MALARRLPTRREYAEDMTQVARVGLLNALDRFDPTRGQPFAGFARMSQISVSRHLGHILERLRALSGVVPAL